MPPVAAFVLLCGSTPALLASRKHTPQSQPPLIARAPLARRAQGFGPDGLGIVTVAGVPNYAALRARLLPLAAALAALPGDARARLEDPESNYNVGWSHGKEALDGGRLDLLKGSFYANPCRWV